MSIIVTRKLQKQTVIIIPPPNDPIPPSGAYRYLQPYLFQQAKAANIPNHLDQAVYVNATPLALGKEGPTNLYVDRAVGWTWDRNGGDFLDLNLVRNAASPAPWGSALLTTFVATPSITITSALQYIQLHGRWNAYLLKISGGTRKIATKFHVSASPPSIAVTYADASEAVLACRIVAFNQEGGSQDIPPQITQTETSMPVFVEFDKPTKAVSAATLTFSTTAGSGGNATISVYILDPPINTAAVELGIAQNYPGDVGLASDASLIGAMITPDGCTIDQFVTPTAPPQGEGEIGFDPHIWNSAAAHDFTKLPHSAIGSPTAILKGGKFVGEVDTTGVGSFSQVTFVNSNYTQEGFVPVAPGVGAMRFFMEAAPVDWNGDPLGDGNVQGGSGGHATTTKRIYFPEPIFGLTNDVYVRYYARYGTPNGTPYRMPESRLFQVSTKGPGHGLIAPTDSIGWTDAGGKWGIMANQDTSYGYNTSSAGGNKGNQFRLAWQDCFSDVNGPDLGGFRLGMHFFDYSVNQPAAYHYADDNPKDDQFGQRGGLGGVIYANNWYCIEAYNKQNTVYLATSFRNALWTRSGTTITVTGTYLRADGTTSATHNLVRPTLVVLESSDHAAVPILGLDKTITVINANSFSFQGANAGGTSGTVTLCDYLPDGILRIWLDGRLAYERLGMATRFVPVYDPGYISTMRRPCRELGLSQLLFNWFHGGANENSVDRVTFISNLAYGSSYIGPMSAPAVTTPAWLTGKALNTWISVNDLGTGLTANGSRMMGMTDMSSIVAAHLCQAGNNYHSVHDCRGNQESAGVAGPRGGIFPFSGGALRTNGSELLLFGGGGATAWAGNDVRGIRLEDDAPTWRIRIAPSDFSVIPPKAVDAPNTANAAYNYDGTPTAFHMYYGPMFIDAQDRFYKFGGLANYQWDGQPSTMYVDSVAWSAGAWVPGVGARYPAADGRTYLYNPAVCGAGDGYFSDPAGQKVSTLNPVNGQHPVLPEGRSVVNLAICKHPTTEDVFWAGTSYIWRFTPSTNASWVRVTNSSLSPCDASVICIDSIHNKLLHIKWGSPTVIHTIDLTPGANYGAITLASFLGTGLPASTLTFPANSGPGLTFDPGIGRFVWFQDDCTLSTGGSVGGLYSIEYVSDSSYVLRDMGIVATAGVAPVLHGSTALGGGNGAGGQPVGVWNRVQYVPNLKGIGIVQAWNQPVWFVRTSL